MLFFSALLRSYRQANEAEAEEEGLGCRRRQSRPRDFLSKGAMAQEQTAPELPLPNRVRDLVTFKLVTPADHSAELAAVRSRFSDARWQRFLADHVDYLENTPPRLWRPMRTDHGYNATPAWTFVARLFDARLPVTNTTLAALGALDLLLVGAMFALLFRTYGYRVACLSLAIFGLGYGWRDIYVGSLLRLDWLAAVVIGICLLKRERFAAAGATPSGTPST